MRGCVGVSFCAVHEAAQLGLAPPPLPVPLPVPTCCSGRGRGLVACVHSIRSEGAQMAVRRCSTRPQHHVLPSAAGSHCSNQGGGHFPSVRVALPFVFPLASMVHRRSWGVCWLVSCVCVQSPLLRALCTRVSQGCPASLGTVRRPACGLGAACCKGAS